MLTRKEKELKLLETFNLNIGDKIKYNDKTLKIVERDGEIYIQEEKMVIFIMLIS